MKGRGEAMRCKEVSALLIEFAENSLGLQERGRVEEHLRECDRCRKELEEIESLYRLLAEESVPAPEESFWTGFLPEVRTRIESKKRTKGLYFPKPRLVVGVLTFLAVAIVSVLMFTPGERHLAERQWELTKETDIMPPELSSTSDQLAEMLLAEGETSLNELLSNGEGRQLDLIEGILEEDYLSQQNLNSVLGELDTEELKEIEESIRELQVGDML
jgi:hypothetical protein